MLCNNVHKTVAVTTTTITVLVAVSGSFLSLTARGVNLFLSEGLRELFSA
jgi:hypothetical protein